MISSNIKHIFKVSFSKDILPALIIPILYIVYVFAGIFDSIVLALIFSSFFLTLAVVINYYYMKLLIKIKSKLKFYKNRINFF